MELHINLLWYRIKPAGAMIDRFRQQMENKAEALSHDSGHTQAHRAYSHMMSSRWTVRVSVGLRLFFVCVLLIALYTSCSSYIMKGKHANKYQEAVCNAQLCIQGKAGSIE